MNQAIGWIAAISSAGILGIVLLYLDVFAWMSNRAKEGDISAWVDGFAVLAIFMIAIVLLGVIWGAISS